MMKEQVVVKNLLISFVIQENAGPQCLLFLHGWRSSSQVWQAVIKDLGLKIKDVSFIALDLPGFGASQTPSNPMAVEDYAEVAAEFIKKLGLKNVIVVGHSFGGRIGIKLASQYPNLIEKLILVDSAGFVTRGLKRSTMRMLAKAVKPFFRLPATQGLRRKMYQFIGAEDYLATPALQATFIKIVNEDLSEEMKKVTCPVLIVWGGEDKETPPSFGEQMNFLIPNSKFVILPNAGHFSFLDQPDEFVKILVGFIK